MSTLKTQLTESVKTAMRERQSERLTVLRGIQAAIKQVEVDQRIELDDQAVLALLEKQLKQRRESIQAYQAAGRDELATKEQTEAVVIQEFLPTPLTDSELDTLIAQAIQATGASSIKDMGQLMATVRPQIMGRADPSEVSKRIKAKLG